MSIVCEIRRVLKIAHSNQICWRSRVFCLAVRVIISRTWVGRRARDSKAFDLSPPGCNIAVEQHVLSFL